jgi:hypothetical protein
MTYNWLGFIGARSFDYVSKLVSAFYEICDDTAFLKVDTGAWTVTRGGVSALDLRKLQQRRRHGKSLDSEVIVTVQQRYSKSEPLGRPQY